VYHATLASRLDAIAEGGLRGRARPNFDASLSGLLFATASEDGAAAWGHEVAAMNDGRSTLLLRFPRPADAVADAGGHAGDLAFRSPVAAEAIEVESEAGGRYVPLVEHVRAAMVQEAQEAHQEANS
jgi:hypothetical protein